MWFGNHERGSRKSKFIAATDKTPHPMVPGMAFHPDSSGGYSEPAVSNSRYDQVARSAPMWFSDGIDSTARSAYGNLPGVVVILAVLAGTSGKYRFWTSPPGVSSWQELLDASREAQVSHDLARANARAIQEKLNIEDLERRRLAAIPMATWLPGYRYDFPGTIDDYTNLWEELLRAQERELEEKYSAARAAKKAMKASAMKASDMTILDPDANGSFSELAKLLKK